MVYDATLPRLHVASSGYAAVNENSSKISGLAFKSNLKLRAELAPDQMTPFLFLSFLSGFF